MPNPSHLDRGSSVEEVEAVVCGCLRTVLPRKRGSMVLSQSTHLFRDLVLDSLQLLQLISLLEEKCSRQVSERDLKAQRLETVGDLCAFVGDLIAKQTGTVPAVAV
jgi:acyl carrier protein